jgi:hypothetical protein
MNSLRQSETGQRTIGGKHAASAGGCLPGWIEECMDAQCGCLPPVPRPAGAGSLPAATWFAPSPRRLNPQGVAEPD